MKINKLFFNITMLFVISILFIPCSVQSEDYTLQYEIIKNSSEADVIVRYGDVDNMGFGFPEGFDLFSGDSTPYHYFPWRVNPSDAEGTDRILVVSSYGDMPTPCGQDGYTSNTSRPENKPEPIQISLPKIDDTSSMQRVILQIFVDDFQATVWCGKYEVTINSNRVPDLEQIINSLNQTGPIGKLITFQLPDYIVSSIKNSSSFSILVDDTTTGAGDGFAFDFFRIQFNPKDEYLKSGDLAGKVYDSKTGKPIINAEVSVNGMMSIPTNSDGYFAFDYVPAGLAGVTAKAKGYESKTEMVDLKMGETASIAFYLIPKAAGEINDLTDIIDKGDSINDVNNENDLTEELDSINDEITVIEKNIPTDGTTPSNEVIEAINNNLENIKNIIDKSNSLINEDKINSEKALKTIELLDKSIKLGKTLVQRGGAININKVKGSIGLVEYLVYSVISKNATSDQMQKSSDNINNMMDNMADYMKIAKSTKDVVNILTPSSDSTTKGSGINGLTVAGIVSAIKGGKEPSKIVDSLGNIVKRGLQEALDAKTISNTGSIVKSAGSIVNRAIYVLQNMTQEQTIIENTLDQLQTEIGLMIDQTTINIQDNPLRSNAFSSAEDNTASVTKNDYKELISNSSDLTTGIVKSKSVLKSTLIRTMQVLSREIIKNILPAFALQYSQNRFAKQNKFETFALESDIENFVDSYPQLLNEIIDISSVDLSSGLLVKSDDIKKVLEYNSSLTEQEKELLIKGLPELPVFDQALIKSEEISLSIVDLLNKELKELEKVGIIPAGTTVEAVQLKGIYLMIILKNSKLGLAMPLYIQDARVVSSFIPEGIHLLPEGKFMLVKNGIAGVITSAPLNAIDALLSAESLIKIKQLFGSKQKEISDIKISNSGDLHLTFKDGSKFSGTFSYGIKTRGDGEFDAGTSSFELQMTDPASEAYSVLVTYSNGTTQTLSPSIAAIEQLVEVLDTLAAGSYTLDKSTGIFTVLDMRFKPSYLIEPIATSEKSWFEANKDGYGIAWETKDYNGDGTSDLKMWTSGILGIAEGKQIIYTVVQ